MVPESTDVLIVGAGPTGLALAASLRQAGVRHEIVDAREGPLNTSRAAVVHAHTVEVLDRIGAAAALQARGLRLGRFAVRDRDGLLLKIGFDDLPTAYSGLLMVPQSSTEEVLVGRLEALGGGVHRGVTATRVQPNERGCTVELRTAEGARHIAARFVVGADGMHSLVREAAGIAFEGESYEESFILADVRMDWPLGVTEVSLYFSPAGLMVVAPLPDGTFRIVATLADPPEEVRVEDVQRIVDERGPLDGAPVREVVWGSRFRLHHRLAETYRCGPLILIGDAAHVHSPAGGQGMNTGLVDAIVLGEALSRVIRRGEPETLLDDYTTIRRQAAAQVLALAGRLTSLATMRPGRKRLLRNLILRLLNRVPAFRKRLALNLSGLARKQYSFLPPPA